MSWTPAHEEAEIARREQAERERDALRATASIDPVWEHRARDAEAEVARLRQDITALRHAVSADHADDPAWTVTDIATLAQAHRSDSESADAHAPLPDIDDGPDYEAVSRDRQREVDELRACLTDAQSLTEQHMERIESAEARFAALTARLESIEQYARRFPALAEFKAIADRLAVLRTGESRQSPDLRLWVQHASTCPKSHPEWVRDEVRTLRPRRDVDPPAICTCGLDAALSTGM